MTALDNWMRRGPFTRVDLGRFRIVYALLALATLPNLGWIAGLPDSMLHPAPGPFRLISSVPPEWMLTGITVALAVSLGLLAVGLHTRVVSWCVAVLMLLSLGLSYSFGKVDHSILLALAPAALSFTPWGESASLDSIRRPVADAPVDHFPLRIFAVLIGVSFAIGAAYKVLGGWLSPGVPTGLGYMLGAQAESLPNPIGDLLGTTATVPLWELADWGIVFLEAAVIVSVLSWVSFRAALAVLTLFHLAVLLTMNIQFGWNVIAYGAFVTWSLVPVPTSLRRVWAWLRARWRAAGAIAVTILAAVGWASATYLAPVAGRRSFTIVVIGACVGAAYLVLLCVRLARLSRSRR